MHHYSVIAFKSVLLVLIAVCVNCHYTAHVYNLVCDGYLC